MACKRTVVATRFTALAVDLHQRLCRTVATPRVAHQRRALAIPRALLATTAPTACRQAVVATRITALLAVPRAPVCPQVATLPAEHPRRVPAMPPARLATTAPAVCGTTAEATSSTALAVGLNQPTCRMAATPPEVTLTHAPATQNALLANTAPVACRSSVAARKCIVPRDLTALHRCLTASIHWEARPPRERKSQNARYGAGGSVCCPVLADIRVWVCSNCRRLAGTARAASASTVVATTSTALLVPATQRPYRQATTALAAPAHRDALAKHLARCVVGPWAAVAVAVTLG